MIALTSLTLLSLGMNHCFDQLDLVLLDQGMNNISDQAGQGNHSPLKMDKVKLVKAIIPNQAEQGQSGQ